MSLSSNPIPAWFDHANVCEGCVFLDEVNFSILRQKCDGIDWLFCRTSASRSMRSTWRHQICDETHVTLWIWIGRHALRVVLLQIVGTVVSCGSRIVSQPHVWWVMRELNEIVRPKTKLKKSKHSYWIVWVESFSHPIVWTLPLNRWPFADRPVQNSALALIWVQQMHWFKNPQRGRQKFLFPTYQVLCYFTRLNIYLSMVIANLLQSKSVFNTTVFAAKKTLYFLLACDKFIWFETASKKFLRIQIFANVLTNQMDANEISIIHVAWLDPRTLKQNWRENMHRLMDRILLVSCLDPLPYFAPAWSSPTWFVWKSWRQN